MPPTDGTTPPPPNSISTCFTLSAGSASFILAALALGTLAQPQGSLVVSPRVGKWRIWRLSPILCGLEGLTLLFFLVQAPFVRISQRQRAFTLMAKRTTATHSETRSLVEYLGRPKLELILPIMLQIWKVLFIRGSILTTSIAVLYWIDWAVVQYCHCLVYFSPFTKEISKCKHTTQHNDADTICDRDWRSRGKAEDHIELNARFWDILIERQQLLEIMTIASLETFLLKRSQVFSFYSISLWLIVYIVTASWIIAPAVSALGLRRGSENFARALSAGYPSLFAFGIILAHYIFVYEEAGTYKPAWLDWFG
jgi:hypothetical protein